MLGRAFALQLSRKPAGLQIERYPRKFPDIPLQHVYRFPINRKLGIAKWPFRDRHIAAKCGSCDPVPHADAICAGSDASAASSASPPSVPADSPSPPPQPRAWSPSPPPCDSPSQLSAELDAFPGPDALSILDALEDGMGDRTAGRRDAAAEMCAAPFSEAAAMSTGRTAAACEGDVILCEGDVTLCDGDVILSDSTTDASDSEAPPFVLPAGALLAASAPRGFVEEAAAMWAAAAADGADEVRGRLLANYYYYYYCCCCCCCCCCYYYYYHNNYYEGCPIVMT